GAHMHYPGPAREHATGNGQSVVDLALYGSGHLIRGQMGVNRRPHGRIEHREGHPAVHPTAGVEVLRPYFLAHAAALPVQVHQLQAKCLGEGAHAVETDVTGLEVLTHGTTSSDAGRWRTGWQRDRKSTRLNSSHVKISYAVFCLKKKRKSSHV